MNRINTRAIQRFLDLKSIRETPPSALIRKLERRKENQSFLSSAFLCGAPTLRIQSAEHMVSRYGSSRKESLCWFLLYLLEMTAQGHIRISRDDIRDDLPLWAGKAWPEAGALNDELASLCLENKGLFSPLDEPGTAVLYSPDFSYFYLLNQRRFENSFLELLDQMTGESGECHLEAGLCSQMESSYLRLKDSGTMPVTEDCLQAALMVGRSRFSVITGGPGTGKTTILAAVLHILTESFSRDSPLSIQLCAPTGRAAKRMAESLGEGYSAHTIHKLLGLRPGAPPRHNEDFPLQADLVVVDEASMIDLSLMTSLLRALKRGCRLLLVGDKDQLPSVESGALLSDFLHGSSRQGHKLEGKVVSLHKVHRNSGAILDASRMVIQGDKAAFHKFLQSPQRKNDHGEGSFLFQNTPGYRDLLNTLSHEYKAPGLDFSSRGFSCPVADWRTVEDQIQSWFALYKKLVVLSPSRKGLYGTRALNRGLDEILGSKDKNRTYHGQPLLVNRNDYERGLYNGDRGIVLRFTDGFYTFFENTEGKNLFFPRALLESCDTAYAQTIHKSQGSEYEKVFLLIPEGTERLLSREILYTGITRARETVQLFGCEEALDQCLERGVRRLSGIRDFMLKP